MDAAGDYAPADAAEGTLAPDAMTSSSSTRSIEASLDDYEKETALASFPADSDGQNESRLLVEDEDGVSREVVVPRLRPGRLSARPPRLRSCPGTGGRRTTSHIPWRSCWWDSRPP